MTDFRFKNLEQFKTGGTDSNMKLSIPVPRSPSGKVHRECKNPSCSPRLFQLAQVKNRSPIAETNRHLVRRNQGERGITCPYCGEDADDDAFLYGPDREAALEQVKWAATKDVAEIIGGMFKSLERSSNSFFKVTSKTPNLPSRPTTWREDLLRDLTCDICFQAYGVYAIGLFCPDCGGRNLAVHFRREVNIVTEQVCLAEGLESDGKNELAYRLLGNAHEDVLTALETYLKTVHRYLSRKRFPDKYEELCPRKTNDFQNMDRARKKFSVFEIDPFTPLTQMDIQFLDLNIQKRHVIGHNLGLVDEGYAQVADTDGYGRTVPLMADEIRKFADLTYSIIAYLETSAPEFLPARSTVTTC